MIRVPGMLIVGARSKSDGKTALTCTLIERFGSQCDIVGIKVTAVDEFNLSHHPEITNSKGDGTGHESYYIIEEKEASPKTDTGKMLAAGAKRVLWLLCPGSHIEQGVKGLLEHLGEQAVSICESNRIRQVIEPGVFIMVKGSKDKCWKASACEVVEYADRVVLFDGTQFDMDLNDIQLVNRQWTIRMPATAILLAGGNSTRMGRDETMLPVCGQPMIQYIYDQLQPHFSQTLISSNNPSLHNFLGATVVTDEMAGQGPLGGMVSALKASNNNVNFVMACDMPDVGVQLIKAMVRQAGDYDAVVPTVGPGRYEPLFAVYKKSVLPAMEHVIQSGTRRVIDCLDHCRIKYIDLPGRPFRNMNTQTEYCELIEKKMNADIG